MKSCYRSRETVYFRRNSTGGALLDAESGDCHTLNTLAATIFELLDGGNTVDQVVERLYSEYGESITRMQLGIDVASVLDEFLKNQLLVKHTSDF